METGQMKAANVEGSFPAARDQGGGAGKVVNYERRRGVRSPEFLVRLLAVVGTLVAAVVVGLDKETRMIPFTLIPNMPPIQVPIPAKWHYVSALKYFLAVNSIACAYSALLLLLSLVGKVSLEVGILFLDLIVLVLLSTATGAAAAVSLLANEGNSHVNWHKICNVYTKFCRQAGAALAVSILVLLLFLTLILLSVFNIRRRCH